MTMHPKSCCCRKEGCGEDIKPAVYLYFDLGPHKQNGQGTGEPYTVRLAEDYLTKYHFVDSIPYGIAYQLSEDNIPDSYYGSGDGLYYDEIDSEAPTLIERIFNKGMLSTSIEDPCTPFCLQDEDIIHPKINASKYGINNEFVGNDGKVRVGLEVDLNRVDSVQLGPFTYSSPFEDVEEFATSCGGDDPLQCFNDEYEFDASLLPEFDQIYHESYPVAGGCQWLNSGYILGKLHGSQVECWHPEDQVYTFDDFTDFYNFYWGFPDMYETSNGQAANLSNRYSCGEWEYAYTRSGGVFTDEDDQLWPPYSTGSSNPFPKRWQHTWHYWDGTGGNNYKNRIICHDWANNRYGDLSPCDSACSRVYPSCFELPIERIDYVTDWKHELFIDGNPSALKYNDVGQRLHELIIERFGPQILENGTVNPYPSQIYYQGAEKGDGSSFCDHVYAVDGINSAPMQSGYWRIVKDLYDIMVETWGEEVANAKFNPCYFDFDTETGRANIEESNVLDGINFCSGHACINKDGELPHVYDRDMTSPGTPYDDSSVPMMCKALHNISNTERKRACCIDGICSDETKENCKSLGGSWNRFNKCIDDVDCSKGVCCWGCGQQMHYNYAKDIMEMPYDYMIESESLSSHTSSKYNNGVRHMWYHEGADDEFRLIETNWSRAVACELVTEEECVHKRPIVKMNTFVERDGHWPGCEDWPTYIEDGSPLKKYQTVLTDAVWEDDCPYGSQSEWQGGGYEDVFRPCIANWRNPWWKWGCFDRGIEEESSGWWLGYGTKIQPTFTAYNSSYNGHIFSHSYNSRNSFTDSYELMFKNKMENMPYIPETVSSRGSWTFSTGDGGQIDLNRRFTMLGICSNSTNGESFIGSSHDCTVRDGFWNPLEEWWNTESGEEIEVGSLTMTCPALLKGINLNDESQDLAGTGCNNDYDPNSMCAQSRENPIEPWELGNFTYNNKHSGGFYYFNPRSWGSNTNSTQKYYHSTVMFNKMATAHHKCCNGDPEKVQNCNWPKNQYNPAFWECSSEEINPAGEEGCGWGSGAKSWPKRYEYESPIDYTPVDDSTITPWIKDYFTSYHYSSPPSNSLYTDVFDNYADFFHLTSGKIRNPMYAWISGMFTSTITNYPDTIDVDRTFDNTGPGCENQVDNAIRSRLSSGFNEVVLGDQLIGYGIAPNYSVFDYNHCFLWGWYARWHIDGRYLVDGGEINPRYLLNDDLMMNAHHDLAFFVSDLRLLTPVDFLDFGHASVFHNYQSGSDSFAGAIGGHLNFNDLWWANVSQNVPYDQGSASWMGPADQTAHFFPWYAPTDSRANFERANEDRSPHHKLGTNQLVAYIQNLHQPCYVPSIEPSYHNPMNWEIFNQLPVSVNEEITGQEQPAKRGMQGNYRGNDPDWQYSNTQMLPVSDMAHWKGSMRNISRGSALGMYDERSAIWGFYSDFSPYSELPWNGGDRGPNRLAYDSSGITDRNAYPEVSQFTCDRVGACCLEDSKYRNPEIMASCMEIKWSDCKKLGGIFIGPQVKCDDYGGVCDKGACCLGHAAFFDKPWTWGGYAGYYEDADDVYLPAVNFATKNDTCFNTVRGLCHVQGFFGTQMGSFRDDDFWPLPKYDNPNTPHFGHFYEGLGCSDLKCNCWSPKYNVSTRYVDDGESYPENWDWHEARFNPDSYGGINDFGPPDLSSPMGHRGWFMNSLPGISIDLRVSPYQQEGRAISFYSDGTLEFARFGWGGDFQTDLGMLDAPNGNGEADDTLGYSCNPNPGIPLWSGDSTPCCCDPRWGHMCDVDNGELNRWTDGFASDVHCKFSGALGACCREDGSCRPNNTKGQCESHPGSEWLGEKTVCTYNSCDFLTDVPEDLGACCCSDGASWSNCFDGVTKQRCEFWDFSIDYVKPENAGNGGCFYYPEQKCVESVNGFLKCPDTSIFGDLDDPNQFPPRIV